MNHTECPVFHGTRFETRHIQFALRCTQLYSLIGNGNLVAGTLCSWHIMKRWSKRVFSVSGGYRSTSFMYNNGTCPFKSNPERHVMLRQHYSTGDHFDEITDRESFLRSTITALISSDKPCIIYCISIDRRIRGQYAKNKVTWCHEEMQVGARQCASELLVLCSVIMTHTVRFLALWCGFVLLLHTAAKSSD